MNAIIRHEPEYYLQKIRSNQPFCLSRFGDGEVLCMFPSNKIQVNCDGSRFTPQLVAPMKQIFINNYNYYHCFLDCTFEPAFKESVDKFKKFFDEVCPDMPIYDGEIWQKLSFDGEIRQLIDAIAPYEPCFVGAKHLESVRFMHGMKGMKFISIPPVDAFDYLNQIFDEIKKVHLEGCNMFLFSAGYSTKPLIDTLFPYFGHDTFFIDMGSCLDPYCGKLSREGMRYVGYKKFQPFTSLLLR